MNSLSCTVMILFARFFISSVSQGTETLSKSDLAIRDGCNSVIQYFGSDEMFEFICGRTAKVVSRVAGTREYCTCS